MFDPTDQSRNSSVVVKLLGRFVHHVIFCLACCQYIRRYSTELNEALLKAQLYIFYAVDATDDLAALLHSDSSGISACMKFEAINCRCRRDADIKLGILLGSRPEYCWVLVHKQVC
jgi:hypothetical protein